MGNTASDIKRLLHNNANDLFNSRQSASIIYQVLKMFNESLKETIAKFNNEKQNSEPAITSVKIESDKFKSLENILRPHTKKLSYEELCQKLIYTIDEFCESIENINNGTI